jgi:hypothetical protein
MKDGEIKAKKIKAKTIKKVIAVLVICLVPPIMNIFGITDKINSAINKEPVIEEASEEWMYVEHVKSGNDGNLFGFGNTKIIKHVKRFSVDTAVDPEIEMEIMKVLSVALDIGYEDITTVEKINTIDVSRVVNKGETAVCYTRVETVHWKVEVDGVPYTGQGIITRVYAFVVINEDGKIIEDSSGIYAPGAPEPIGMPPGLKLVWDDGMNSAPAATQTVTPEAFDYEGDPEPMPVPELEREQDYIIADSANKTLKDKDISGLTTAQLRIARNEIYARHGRMFKDPLLKT